MIPVIVVILAILAYLVNLVILAGCSSPSSDISESADSSVFVYECVCVIVFGFFFKERVLLNLLESRV